MDLSRFRPSDWLKIGGGALFLIAGLLTWWKIEGTGQLEGNERTGNAFEWFPTGTLPWLLFIAVGVLTALIAFRVIESPTFPADRIILGLAVIGAILFAVRFAIQGFEVPDGLGENIDQTRGLGLWIGLVGALMVLAGAVMAFLDSNKVGTTTAGSYGDGYGSSSTPPPPPPSY